MEGKVPVPMSPRNRPMHDVPELQPSTSAGKPNGEPDTMSVRTPCPFHELPRPLVPVGNSPDDELNRSITLELLALFHDAIHRYAMRLLALEVSPLANPLRGQGQVIALLKQGDGLTTKEMAQLLGIRTASLNELLVKLEAKGLIMRSRSNADGRVTVVALTDAGRAVEQAPFVAEMQAFLGEMGSFYDTLTREEKQSLAGMLHEIDEAMRRAVPEETQMESDTVGAGATEAAAGTQASATATETQASPTVAETQAAPTAVETPEVDDESLEDRIIRNLEMWGTLSKLARALDLDPRRDT